MDFFTNHSLRRTAATRLFQAGKNTKIIKEVTGHISDAVEKNEITSDTQRMKISEIIQGDVSCETEKVTKKLVKDDRVVVKHKVEPMQMDISENSNVDRHVETTGNVIKTDIDETGNRKAWLTITIDLLDWDNNLKNNLMLKWVE